MRNRLIRILVVAFSHVPLDRRGAFFGFDVIAITYFEAQRLVFRPRLVAFDRVRQNDLFHFQLRDLVALRFHAFYVDHLGEQHFVVRQVLGFLQQLVVNDAYFRSERR